MCIVSVFFAKPFHGPDAASMPQARENRGKGVSTGAFEIKKDTIRHASIFDTPCSVIVCFQGPGDIPEADLFQLFRRNPCDQSLQ